MIAFLNAAILYLIFEKKGKVNDGYTWIKDRIAPRIGRFFIELITCVFCLAFWISLIEGLIGGYSVLEIGMNWTLTFVLYKLMTI